MITEQEFLQVLAKNNPITPEALSEHFDIDIKEVRGLAYSLEAQRKIRIVSGDTHTYELRESNSNSSALLIELQNRLEYEKGVFFSCSRHKYTYQEAMDVDFKCPKCGHRLTPYNNKAIIRTLEKAIGKFPYITGRTKNNP